jgi:hypothetical protein
LFIKKDLEPLQQENIDELFWCALQGRKSLFQRSVHQEPLTSTIAFDRLASAMATHSLRRQIGQQIEALYTM